VKSEEADKIIADFMNRKIEYIQCGSVVAQHIAGERKYTGHSLYSRSLDVLVPVWEKLEDICVNLEIKGNFCSLNIPGTNCCLGLNGSIQEAAAIATAKAILELKDQE